MEAEEEPNDFWGDCLGAFIVVAISRVCVYLLALLLSHILQISYNEANRYANIVMAGIALGWLILILLNNKKEEDYETN